MGTMTFHSDDPDLQSADVLHPQSIHADRLEHALRQPAFWNSSHPLHSRAKSDVAALSALVYGDTPITSGNSPTFIVNSANGEPIEHEFAAPTVATGEGLADEHNKVE